MSIYWLDTNEKIQGVINSLENGEIVVGGNTPTEEDFVELGREIAKYKAARRAMREAAPTRQVAYV